MLKWPRVPVRLLPLLLCGFILCSAGIAHAAPLSGTYTIGGTDPHFVTIQDATAALSANGVDGPVVFDIRTGIYDGPVSVPDTAGVSVDNTITFQSEAGNASDVTVRSDSGVWVIFSDYVTLQHLTIMQEPFGTSDYGRVLTISGDTDHIKILNNRLHGRRTTTNIRDRYAVLFNWKTSTYAADDILIEGNEILYGSVGIDWDGSTLITGSELRVRNNSIREFGINGVQILKEPALELIGNEIASRSIYLSYPYGVILEFCDGPILVDKNRISVDGHIGMGIRESHSTTAGPGLITNNFVSVDSGRVGLNIDDSEYQTVAHNTVRFTGTYQSDPALKVYDGTHHRLLNNILMNTTDGAAISITFPDISVDQCDYNLLYSASGAIGITSTFTTHYALADWQAATGHDLNSVEAEALFVSAEDSHLVAGSPGIDLALTGEVIDDIDYELRPVAADMGADEYLGVTPTIGASLTCTPDSGVLPFTTQMAVDLANLTTENRRAAARINMVLANGTPYTNWRAGWTNLSSGETFSTSWNQNLPALGTLVGSNVFTIVGEDVTPAPYNQPPFAPSGDTATDDCTVTASAP